MELKNPELADEAEVKFSSPKIFIKPDEEEEKFSSPKIFIKPSKNITWENHRYWPIAVTPEDSDTSTTYSL